MYISNNLIAISTLLCSAFAQTPSGFSPSASTKLGVTFKAAGKQADITVTPGLAVPRQDTATQPTITVPAGASSNASTFMIFMLDLDVNMNNTRTTLLHWFQPDLVLGAAGNGTLMASSSNKSGPGAAYIQPSPPPGDIAHRYTQILFAQPANFAVPKSFASINPPASSTTRIGFSLANFVSAAGLQAPLAGNFITVQNTTGSATGSASSSGATSTTTPFKGGASAVAVSYGLIPLAGLGAFMLGMLLV